MDNTSDTLYTHPEFLDSVASNLLTENQKESHLDYNVKRAQHGDSTLRLPQVTGATNTNFVGIRRPRQVANNPYSPYQLGIDYNNSPTPHVYF